MESVLKEVGLADDEDDNDEDAGVGPGPRAGPAGKEKGKGKGKDREGKEDRVWLHCNVGARMDVKKEEDKEEEEVSAVSSARPISKTRIKETCQCTDC